MAYCVGYDLGKGSTPSTRITSAFCKPLTRVHYVTHKDLRWFSCGWLPLDVLEQRVHGG